MNLQERTSMKERVFERDKFRCVICEGFPDAAHHLLERRLWKDDTQGYLMDNLVTLCAKCHFIAEQTHFSLGVLREKAGITNIVVPDHLYKDQEYDKWGNPILSNGKRLKGELFDEDSVQDILQPVMYLFTPYVKYPRTYHLPWSHPNKDDQSHVDVSFFEGKEVIVTEKYDGECITMYDNHVHARSVDSPRRKNHSWLMNYWSDHAQEQLGPDERICGEYLFEEHSIHYGDLKSFFYGFSYWEGLTCVSWDDTLFNFEYYDVEPVKELYRGVWDEKAIRSIELDLDTQEGYVVRLADSFHYKDFSKSVAKFVREGHLQTTSRWKREHGLNTLASSNKGG